MKQNMFCLNALLNWIYVHVGSFFLPFVYIWQYIKLLNTELTNSQPHVGTKNHSKLTPPPYTHTHAVIIDGFLIDSVIPKIKLLSF